MAEIGKRIRERRERLGVTQHELAEQSGTSRDVIAKLESGLTHRPRNPERLAKALNVPLEWLLTGSSSATTSASIHLEDGELQILAAYRALSVVDQQLLQTIARRLAAERQTK